MYAKIINSKLIQGSRPSFKLLKNQKKIGVNTVMDIGYSRLRDKPFQAREYIYCLLLGLDYKRRPSTLVGSFPKINFFKKVTKEVMENNGITFMHCRSGLHRANLLAQAVEILSNKKPVNKAIEEIKMAGYFTFKKSAVFRIKKMFGLITTERVQANLTRRLEAFKKTFEQI